MVAFVAIASLMLADELLDDLSYIVPGIWLSLS